MSAGVAPSTRMGLRVWAAVPQGLGRTTPHRPKRRRKDRQLVWVACYSFASKLSKTKLVLGEIGDGEGLVLESLMSHDRVVFTDGIESDYRD